MLQKEKRTPDRILKKIYATARGEHCRIKFQDICVGGTDTVVFAHLNSIGLGAGRGLKSEYGCPACHACHSELDQGTQLEKDFKRSRHTEETLKYLHCLKKQGLWSFK